MSLLPDDATFHERVQALLAFFRARGVALSPKDLELLDEWHRVQVPFEVIARGIRIAAERATWDARPGEGRLRSLVGARRVVESEIAKYLKASAGRTSVDTTEPAESFLSIRHKKLAAAVARLRKAYPSLRPLELPRPATFQHSERQEHLVFVWLMRSLDLSERVQLQRACLGLLTATSRQARLRELRFHRTALVRLRFALKPLW